MFLENTGSHDTIKVYTKLNVPDLSSVLLKKDFLNTVEYLELTINQKTHPRFNSKHFPLFPSVSAPSECPLK